MKKIFALLLILLISASAFAQQEVIRLYPGKAPGSESWNWQEAVEKHPWDPNYPHIYNIVDPTLTVFKPAPAKNSGTAIIIAPGGGFQVLAFKKEGTEAAQWLSNKGVTVFVLKYRVNHSTTDEPLKEMFDVIKNTPAGQPYQFGKVVELAMQDGLHAVAYVRKNAAKYNIDPNKIGFMGFSAGGTITMSVAMNATNEERPNFIGAIYAYFAGAIGDKVPTEKMPAFICAASNDDLGLAPQSIEIYNKWVAAGQEAELHIYEKGGHGFGTRKQGLPTDTWIERFGDWLAGRGLISAQKSN